jgi:hypothetical protein
VIIDTLTELHALRSSLRDGKADTLNALDRMLQRHPLVTALQALEADDLRQAITTLTATPPAGDTRLDALRAELCACIARQTLEDEDLLPKLATLIERQLERESAWISDAQMIRDLIHRQSNRA